MGLLQKASKSYDQDRCMKGRCITTNIDGDMKPANNSEALFSW